MAPFAQQKRGPITGSQIESQRSLRRVCGPTPSFLSSSPPHPIEQTKTQNITLSYRDGGRTTTGALILRHVSDLPEDNLKPYLNPEAVPFEPASKAAAPFESAPKAAAEFGILIPRFVRRHRYPSCPEEHWKSRWLLPVKEPLTLDPGTTVPRPTEERRYWLQRKGSTPDLPAVSCMGPGLGCGQRAGPELPSRADGQESKRETIRRCVASRYHLVVSGEDVHRASLKFDAYTDRLLRKKFEDREDRLHYLIKNKNMKKWTAEDQFNVHVTTIRSVAESLRRDARWDSWCRRWYGSLVDEGYQSLMMSEPAGYQTKARASDQDRSQESDVSLRSGPQGSQKEEQRQTITNWAESAHGLPFSPPSPPPATPSPPSPPLPSLAENGNNDDEQMEEGNDEDAGLRDRLLVFFGGDESKVRQCEEAGLVEGLKRELMVINEEWDEKIGRTRRSRR